VRFITKRSELSGAVDIPPSKSHTIRALLIATLATRACAAACARLGADVQFGETCRVVGVGNPPRAPEGEVDVANSGTTLFFTMGAAALAEGRTVLTGDAQTRKRSAQPLINALNDLGAKVTARGEGGCAPIVVEGPLRGGHTRIACPTSQYLSSLLLCCPLAEKDSVIEVTELNEAPYVDMTLTWLNNQGIEYYREGMRRFEIVGGQAYEPFQERIAGDFSSATFFLVAAAVTGSTVTLRGLNMNDPQGDKQVVDMLEAMGAKVTIRPSEIVLEGAPLRGLRLDLNATPDALPAMAVAGCFARGTTRLTNVPQARIKETDRIAAMHQALAS